MKKGVFLSVCYLLLLGCRKETVEYPAVIVYDYVNGHPVEGARVVQRHYYDFNPNCFCYSSYSDNTVGTTSASGRLDRLISVEGLWVRKEGFFDAGPYIHCVYEKKGEDAHYGLFKKGFLDIQAQPARTYTEPVHLEIYPLLKDNQVPPLPFVPDEFGLTGSSRFDAAAYAGLNNRVLVLKRKSGGAPGYDTLYRRDVFLPENGRVIVGVNY